MAIWDIHPSGGEPLFQQIVHAVKRAVATGRLQAGDKLPSVRELAREQVINPNTVARAYQVLESEGVTHSRRGAGTFVAERRVVLKLEERRRRLRAALDEVLSDAVNLDLSEEEVRKAFDAALKRVRFQEGAGFWHRGSLAFG